MKSNEELKNFYDEKVKEYFANLEWKVLEGYYEELTDISLFDQIGTETRVLASFVGARTKMSSEYFGSLLLPKGD